MPRYNTKMPKIKKSVGRPRKERKVTEPLRPVGRPPFEVNLETRQRVERLLAARMTLKAVAAAVGCELPTFRKHFADEIENGKARIEAQVVDALYAEAFGGNVSALRKVYAIVTGRDEMTMPKALKEEREAEGSDGGKKIGKKEQQFIDAKNVPGKFEAPEPPSKHSLQ